MKDSNIHLMRSVRHTFTDTFLYNSESRLCSARFGHHTAVVRIRLAVTGTNRIIDWITVLAAYTLCRIIGESDTLSIELAFFVQTWVTQSCNKKTGFCGSGINTITSHPVQHIWEAKGHQDSISPVTLTRGNLRF